MKTPEMLKVGNYWVDALFTATQRKEYQIVIQNDRYILNHDDFIEFEDVEDLHLESFVLVDEEDTSRRAYVSVSEIEKYLDKEFNSDEDAWTALELLLDSGDETLLKFN